MADFTWNPDYSSDKTVKPRVIRANFGDGYSQRTADGINNAPEVWSVIFVRSIATIDSIETFLADKEGAESFDWTPPGGTEKKFTCPEWSRGWSAPGIHKLTATFQQEFDL